MHAKSDFKMPKKFSRKFDGKRYYPQVVRKKKSTAKADAASLRRKGSTARVTKESDGYVVWLGPKRK